MTSTFERAGAATAIVIFLLCGTAFAQEHKVGINKYVIPEYPPIARQAHAQGDVVFDLLANGKGEILQVQYMSGHPILREVAARSIADWRLVCLDCRPGQLFWHRITVTYKIVEGDGCGLLFGFKRYVLEFPQRLTIEVPPGCIVAYGSGLPAPRRINHLD